MRDRAINRQNRSYGRGLSTTYWYLGVKSNTKMDPKKHVYVSPYEYTPFLATDTIDVASVILLRGAIVNRTKYC